jgi:uncharacterized protein (TIGR02757 family)
MPGSLDYDDMKLFLDENFLKYNSPAFIETDPIQIPHRFFRKEDIEIAGFLTASIAWGQRISIIKSASRLMEFMQNNPFEFIVNADESDLKMFQYFTHRTFSGEDCIFFLKSLKNIYTNHGGMEKIFNRFYYKTGSIYGALAGFREVFFEIPHSFHVLKHISNVSSGSAAKRLNMFLRWMVRQDKRGIDFGIWQNIPESLLYIPLDVHTGNAARMLNLLNRKQNDWKAVEELTMVLRKFDPVDPIKYDFALFGLGLTKNIINN